MADEGRAASCCSTPAPSMPGFLALATTLIYLCPDATRMRPASHEATMKKTYTKTKHPGLYRTPSGDWHVLATLKTQGKQRRATATMAAETPLHELLAAQARLKATLEVALVTAAPEGQGAVTQRLTVAAYAACWLKTRAVRIKPSVLTTYITQLELHVLPALGDYYLDALTRSDLERWASELEQAKRPGGEGYARDTVMGWWALALMLLRDAVADHQLPVDPTSRVRPPQVRTAPCRERRTLSEEEIPRLLDACAVLAPQRYLEVLVLATTGIRLGELYGLRWDDVGKRALTIRSSAYQGELTDTKTHTPRVVYLASEVGDALAAHRLEQLAVQHPGLELGLVFPSDVGTPREGGGLRKALELASRGAELELIVTPQVLRRTFNTLSVASGVNPIILRSQMGHTREDMTIRYAGASVEQKAHAMGPLVSRVIPRVIPVGDT
jgi:integrase